MMIFTKLIYLTNKAYFEFSASVFEYIYLTVRELCHHQNPLQFAFLHHYYLLFKIYFFALPCSFYIAVTLSETQPMSVDGRQSMKQMCRAAVPQHTQDTLILVLVHGCSINEMFHFLENQKVSIM